MAIKLSLVVPCYNEEATLAAIVERIFELRSENLALEIVIVDDCSSDRSREIAQTLAAEHPEITLAFHEVNQGKGAALRTGFLKASGDYVGIQDADMEYNPLDYLKMLEPMLDGRADVVYGSRYLKPDTRRVLYFWHSCMNKFLTFASNMFTDLGITDMETCYKLFKREVIQAIAPRLKEKRFGFEPEVTTYVAEAKVRVYECAISYNPRTFEEGKKIGWRDGMRALYCIMHYGACNAPVPMQLLIYFFIGTVAALVNLGVFAALLKGSALGLEWSAVISYLVSAAVNYLLCIAILFRHKARWNTAGELFAYMITLAVMGGIDYGLTKLLVEWIKAPVWGKLLASLVGFFGNYFLRRCFVFPLMDRKK
ncbi:MAG: bifunctional glycosyltransferase family 2/GtrA family protein [Lentisphaeria bacterium]|nr:bifunctional glycosyltransferase family 2/GtrA family protein [Lentisphaeria bacterium]